jgi:hypothetical protein
VPLLAADILRGVDAALDRATSRARAAAGRSTLLTGVSRKTRRLLPAVCPSHRISRRLRLPRSQFYAQALEAYVRVRSGEDITERLNEVYAKTSSKLDPAAEALSLEVLRQEKW